MAIKQLGVAAFCGTVLFCTLTQSAQAAPAYFFTRNSMMNDVNIQPYMDDARTAGGDMQTIFVVDFNPMTANHLRDFEKMRETLREFSRNAPDGVVIFGYSATAKFIAKLAAEEANVRGVFLMDPVDGTPPFVGKKNFPVFLDDQIHIKVPTWIVQSEFGVEPATMGKACVPKEYDGVFFGAHVEPSFLNYVKVPGSGHNDFLNPPVSLILQTACKRGTVPSQEVLGFTREFFGKFISSLK
jgi:pimeloyl-ACP methyl ester carboxylesterase